MSEKMIPMLKDFIENVTKKLVDKKDDVTVNTSLSTKSVIIQIKVAKQDCGKIIGKKGRTVDALKVLTIAIKNTMIPSDKRKVIIEILEDENSNFKY